MKISSLKALALMCIATFAVSCGSDDDNSPSSSFDLKGGKWYTESQSIKTLINGQVVSESSTILEECEKDDYMVFNGDGTYNETVTDKVCDATDENDSGKWSLSSDGKKLTMDAGTIYEFVYNIESSSASKAVLSGSKTATEDGVTATTVIKMTVVRK